MLIQRMYKSFHCLMGLRGRKFQITACYYLVFDISDSLDIYIAVVFRITYVSVIWIVFVLSLKNLGFVFVRL